MTFGVRWRDREFQAGNGGTAGVIHVLSGGEEVRWAVALDLQVLGELRTGQSRIDAVMHPWARFTDKLGKTYEREWPAPDPDQASASGG